MKQLTIINDTEESFRKAFELLSLEEKTYDKKLQKPVFKCNGYVIKDNELYLSSYSKDVIQFPFPYDLKMATDFAYSWLQHNSPTAEEPDTDGSVNEGYIITTDDCGVGSSDWGLFVKIVPTWIVYGK